MDQGMCPCSVTLTWKSCWSDINTFISRSMNGKRVHLHDVPRLPPGTAVRVAWYPLKEGGLQKHLQVHTRQSLGSSTKQEVRAIATALGVKTGSRARDARVFFTKEQMIERILTRGSDPEPSVEVGEMRPASSSSAASTALRSTSSETSIKSSQSSLLRMFAA